MKPGLHFYKWLLRGSALHVPIPDTLIVEKNIVRFIFTDPITGQIMKLKPSSDSQDDKRIFFHTVMNRLMDQPQYLPQQPNAISRRVVAVLKKPFWRNTVSNETEILLPLPLAAQILDAVDGKPGPFVIQKFMNFRGKKPAVYRAFWKAGSPTKARALTVWNISNKDNVTEFPGMAQLANLGTVGNKIR